MSSSASAVDTGRQISTRASAVDTRRQISTRASAVDSECRRERRSMRTSSRRTVHTGIACNAYEGNPANGASIGQRCVRAVRPGCIQAAGQRRVWASHRAAILCPGVSKMVRGIVATSVRHSEIFRVQLWSRRRNFLFFLSSLVPVGCGCGVVGVVVVVVGIVQLWCVRNMI